MSKDAGTRYSLKRYTWLSSIVILYGAACGIHVLAVFSDKWLHVAACVSNTSEVIIEKEITLTVTQDLDCYRDYLEGYNFTSDCHTVASFLEGLNVTNSNERPG